MKPVSVSEAMSRKSPEWIVMVVSVDTEGVPNVMPAGWAMICSGDPRYVAVSIAYERYTYDCIHNTGEFVFAWAGKGQEQLVADAGTTSGADIDKFTEFSIPHTEAAEVSVPLLEGAAANLECRVAHEYASGDHAIFVGEVVAASVPDRPIPKLENFSGEYRVAQKKNDVSVRRRAVEDVDGGSGEE